ncbi:MAG: hypothetical protein HYY18_20385 [Planctomycetes bacterium]|nr:hypothetical protein [Planctomycetota bacterium]
MSDAPETRQVSATRRMARTLARVPRNPAFGWFLIATGAVLYLVAIFNPVVDFQTSPSGHFGLHSHRGLGGWEALWVSIAHLRTFVTGGEGKYPRHEGWAALAGLANIALLTGMVAVVFARTRRKCFPVVCTVGLAAVGVVLTGLWVEFTEKLNGWEVEWTDGAYPWGMAFLCIGIGVLLRWRDLSPERIEKRKLEKQEKMGRLERHGV